MKPVDSDDDDGNDGNDGNNDSAPTTDPPGKIPNRTIPADDFPAADEPIVNKTAIKYFTTASRDFDCIRINLLDRRLQETPNMTPGKTESRLHG